MLDELKISAKEEFEVIKKAAEAGNINAMIKLVDFYENGKGTKLDKELAEIWRKKINQLNNNL